MTAGDPEVGTGVSPEASGLAGDPSERCAWDLARFVLLDIDLKRKEYVIMLLAGG